MKWSDEDIEYLKSEYAKLSGKNVTNIIEKISKKLGKSKSSVRNKAYELKITHKEKYYTEEQINFLRENIDKMTFIDMGIILGKNHCNVYRKCKELGIKKSETCTSKLVEYKPRYKFTKEDIQRSVETNRKKAEMGLHPKGYLGHKHNDETRKKLSEASKKGWANATEKSLEERRMKMRNTKLQKYGTLSPFPFQKNPYSRAKGGKRVDLNNMYFRSAWEANIARYYNFAGIKWEYEPKTFVFQNITRGSVSYTPDFYLPETDQWVEIKGWMDGKSKTKLKRFEKQYPEEYKKLIIIQEKEYNEIKRKVAPFIKEWE